MTRIPDTLRNLVIERAHSCCEYCLIPQASKSYSFEVDHIVAEKHRGITAEHNLALACLDCNRHKGSDFASFDPVTDQVALLYNPRKDNWSDHFALDGAYIKALTPQGRVTQFLLELNSEARIVDREVLIEAGEYPPAHFVPPIENA
ncbi:MAG: HNH endonuclease [Anaerolineae bacterium]|nr:HNH endonuclease [Anaerolineae bacterium]